MKIEVKYSVKPVDYMKSMQILEKRVQDVFLGKKVELLWILEHNSVYTGGTSSSQVDILDKNLKVIKTNRGGKITYHGPGQKVAYFVLNLMYGVEVRPVFRHCKTSLAIFLLLKVSFEVGKERR